MAVTLTCPSLATGWSFPMLRRPAGGRQIYLLSFPCLQLHVFPVILVTLRVTVSCLRALSIYL